jgi:DNA-binding transcriptional ArsR family regulator
MPGKHDVTRFIRSTFRSVWALEMLCLLRKHADRDWAEAELVAALRASDLIVSQNLAALTAAGLVTVRSDGQVRYQPATPALDGLVLASEALYARSPDAVRRLIVASATSDVAAFADAFRFRRD